MVKVRISSRTFYDPLGFKPKKQPLSGQLTINRKLSKTDEDEYSYSMVIGKKLCEMIMIDDIVHLAIGREGIFLSAYPLVNGIECYLSDYGKHKKLQFNNLIHLIVKIFDFELEYNFVQCDKIKVIDENILFIMMEEKSI